MTAAEHSEKPWHDPELLRELYHGEGLSLRDMGEHFGVEHSTVRRAMDRYGVERREGDGGSRTVRALMAKAAETETGGDQ